MFLLYSSSMTIGHELFFLLPLLLKCIHSGSTGEVNSFDYRFCNNFKNRTYTRLVETYLLDQGIITASPLMKKKNANGKERM